MNKKQLITEITVKINDMSIGELNVLKSFINGLTSTTTKMRKEVISYES